MRHNTNAGTADALERGGLITKRTSPSLLRIHANRHADITSHDRIVSREIERELTI